jgi:hypothetical protein
MYDDLIGSLESSYSSEYMLEIIADRDSDLSDITQIVKYLSKFVDESDVEVEGRSIDVVFGVSSKLGKIISKMGVEKIERQIADDLKPYGGAGIVIHEPDMDSKEDMIGNLRTTSIEDEEYPTEEAEDVLGTKDPYLEQLKKAMEEATGQSVEVVTGEESLNENSKVDLKKTLRNIGVAAALTGGAMVGGNKIPDAIKTGSEMLGGVVGDLGGNAEFFSKLSTEEAKTLKAAMQNVRDAGKDVALTPNAGVIKRSYGDAKDYLDDVVTNLRRDKRIGPEIKFHFNEGTSYTSSYLTEQAKRDSVERIRPQQNQSFKERYKPKTSYQLDELRRYGL